MIKKEILCVIPARGGSKGISQKNIRLISRKPLLSYTLEHALYTSLISRIIVSTDNLEISLLAKRYNVEVVRRPKELSTDSATSESAITHVLNYLKKDENYVPDLVVFLQATSPLRQPNDINNAINTLISKKADSLFSACRLNGLIWREEKNKLVSISYDHNDRKRRQKLPNEMLENGSIYIFKPWVLSKFNNRLGGKIATYHMNPLDSFQVDELDDIKIIERLLKLKALQL